MNLLSNWKQKDLSLPDKHILPFYPLSDLDEVSDEITIDKFEEYADYRVKLYLKIDKNEISLDAKKEEDPRIRSFASVTLENREMDIISHFIMRAAFCSNNTDRVKFIDRESRLFEYRLMKVDMNSALEQSGYKPQQVTMEEMREKFEDIRETGTFYVMRFQDVPRQLASRSVYLRSGMAYIHERELKHYLVTRFEDDLREGLEAYASIQHQFLDPRFEETLKKLTIVALQEDYVPSDTITADAIPRLAKQSFPLCMMRMYKKLCDTNHLYYDGREQFGRFLKGIGLSMEGALEFFQNHFCRSISIDKFNKEYAYNIRYMYGKEGRRIPLPPHPCKVMIKTIPVGDQCHGCPFASMRDVELEALLKNLHVDSDHIGNILQYHREKNYEKACREYFLAIHSGTTNEGIALHPVLWFKKSRSYYEEKGKSQKYLVCLDSFLLFGCLPSVFHNKSHFTMYS